MIPIPWGLITQIGLPAVIVAGAFVGGCSHGSAKVKRAWDQEKAAAIIADRVEEQRRVSEHKEIAHESERLARLARDAAVRSAVAGDGLRERAAAVAARCPATAEGGASAPSPGLVLADVLGRLDAAGRELAAEADRRGIAGQTCERAYDALTRSED